MGHQIHKAKVTATDVKGREKVMRMMLWLSLLVFSGSIQAKAYFASLHEMVDKSHLIVRGEVITIEKGEFKSDSWTYKQKVTVRVIETLKGLSDQNIVILGDEDFICAQSKYDYGSYLLFLNKRGDTFQSANWQQGAIKIENSKLKWFPDKDSRLNTVEKTYELAKREIDNLIKVPFEKNH